MVIALLRLQAPTLAFLPSFLPSLVLGMIRNDSKNAPHLLSKAALLHVQAMMPASNLFGSYIGEQLPGAEAYGHPQLTPFWIPRWRDAGDGNMWQVGTTMKDHGPVQNHSALWVIVPNHWLGGMISLLRARWTASHMHSFGICTQPQLPKWLFGCNFARSKWFTPHLRMALEGKEHVGSWVDISLEGANIWTILAC